MKEYFNLIIEIGFILVIWIILVVITWKILF